MTVAAKPPATERKVSMGKTKTVDKDEKGQNKAPLVTQSPLKIEKETNPKKGQTQKPEWCTKSNQYNLILFYAVCYSISLYSYLS